MGCPGRPGEDVEGGAERYTENERFRDLTLAQIFPSYRKVIHMQVKNRIKELRQVKASELLPNAKNWRRHPKWQHDGMKAVLENIGYAGALIAYENEGQLILIDGHLRQEMTMDEEVPVLILDVNEQEADILLATYDPLTAMASQEGAVLHELLDGIESQNDELRALLEDINERYDASAIMEVANSTEAYYLPNQTIGGLDRADSEHHVPTDEEGNLYRAFLVHFPQEQYNNLMEGIFKLGERWNLETTASVLQKAIKQLVEEE
jgi:hypothetical protein